VLDLRGRPHAQGQARHVRLEAWPPRNLVSVRRVRGYPVFASGLDNALR
jgi:hypothetical protein